MKKKIITLLATLIMANTMLTTSWAAISCPQDYSYVEQNSGEKSARVDDIGYQYKLIDNVLYRRLYNFTARKPVGDWEIVP